MSKIEWTEQTWNPIIGCSKISDGCKNCYAEKMAGRLASMEQTVGYKSVVKSEQMDGGEFYPDEWVFFPEWNGKTTFIESILEKPLKRKKPTMYFVCSMGDLFHESVPFEWIKKVFDVIAQTPQHTYQVLTKRPNRMLDFIKWLANDIKECGFDSIPTRSENILDYYEGLPNLWLGVTAENQEQANKRIPVLLKIPASVRFVSIEPMLGVVNLNAIEQFNAEGKHVCYYQVLQPIKNCGDSNRPALDWVICGGESGSNARPMHPDWVRSVRDQCKEANVPFFFKQWGEWLPGEITENHCYKYVSDGSIALFPAHSKVKRISFDSKDNNSGNVCAFKVGKKKAGSQLDGKEFKEFPKGDL